jgi:hypothetical protein
VKKKKLKKKTMPFGGKKAKKGRGKMARGMSAMMAPSPMMGGLGGKPFGK